MTDKGAPTSGADAEREAKAAFSVLRPVCVRVMRAPSLETLGELEAVLHEMQSLHPHLVDYVVLPLRMIIKRKSNVRLLEAGLDVLALVFSRVRGMDSAEVFQELLLFMCMLLDRRMARETGFGDCSEDLAVSNLRAMKSLLLSTTESLHCQLLSQLPTLGHCISVLLDTLHTYQSKAVRRATLQSLLALTKMDAEKMVEGLGSAHILSELSECVGVGGGGGVFASFLPGIAIALTKLVTTDTAKVGQAVTSLAVMVWAHYVCLVMGDRQFATKEEPTPVPPPAEKAPNTSDEPRSLAVERTREWCVDTDHKLSILAHKMTASLVMSEGWRVRVGMVVWAHSLLTHCHRTLGMCMPPVLELLVTLTHDSYTQVSENAHQALEMFSEQYATEGPGQLTAVLEERLHTLASSLPRLMRQHDDTHKMSTLQLLAGYLQLLGPHIISLTYSHPHLSRITQALTQTLKLEVGDMGIVEQPSTAVGEEERVGGEEWVVPLRYQYFRSERIEALLHHVCQLLGFYGSLPILLDHLLDSYRESSVYRKELFIIISQVLLGAGGGGCVEGKKRPPHAVLEKELFSLVERVLEELVAPGNWQESSETFSLTSPPTSPHDAALLSSLLLRTVAVCAQVTGKAFDQLLQLVVCPLMQKLGHSSMMVSGDALVTLKTICFHCGYSSLQQLITKNADYLVNSVALQLRSSVSPEAIQVLQAVLKYGDPEVLPLMQDSVDKLLLLLDIQQDPAPIWPALHTLASAVARWSLMEDKTPSSAPPSPPTPPSPPSLSKDIPSPQEQQQRPHVTPQEQQQRPRVTPQEQQQRPRVTPQEQQQRPRVTPEEIRQFFLDYHRRKKEESLGMSEEQEDVSDMSQDKEDYTQKRKLPPHHQAAVDVLQRCAPFLSSPSPSLRLTVLDTAEHCITTLRTNKTTLLPEVHGVWPALLPRLDDPAHPVALKAWEVLMVMGDVCGDFLRRRVVAKVWPPLVRTLESLASQSVLTDQFYSQTVSFKLQRKLLQCVGTLCQKLDMSAADSEQLAHACVPYLSCDQPEQLQRACCASFTTLIQRDPDCMWLLLQQLQPQETTHPHPTLKPYKFPLFPDAHKYTTNVQMLLESTR